MCEMFNTSGIQTSFQVLRQAFSPLPRGEIMAMREARNGASPFVGNA